MPDLGGGSVSVERFADRSKPDSEFEGRDDDAYLKARGVHGLHMVRMVESSGSSYRFPYPYLMPLVETPGELVCTFADYRVTITGTNLAGLADLLGQYRVKEVRKGGPGSLGAVVTRVKIERLEE